MEDLAHFIKSMSEKYGLLDADNKESREFHDMAGNKQIQECPSSAASNSYNNEVCLGQASSWEDLSIFISGQTLDSNSSHGSRNLHAVPVPFHSQDDSRLHAPTRMMIDINKEPAPESPLPGTSVVVSKEKDSDDMLTGSGSMVELGQSTPHGKNFPNIVTMSDYLQPVYCSQESSQELRLADNETCSDGPCQLEDLPCRSGETSSREDSSSPLPEDQRRNVRFCSRDEDDCPESGDPSGRSHRIESEKSNCVCVEAGHAQPVASGTTSTTGDGHGQYGSWDLAMAESQSRHENACAWEPMSRNNSACQQAQTRSRKQSDVVWSFADPDGEVESGENVASHENAISRGGSRSRSCHLEGGGTETDFQEEVYDGRSRARLQMNVGHENSKHQVSNISSDSNHDEHEEEAVGCSSLNNTYGENHHNFFGSLEDEERGGRSLPGSNDALLKNLEGGNTMVDEQAREAVLDSSNAFAWGETRPKFGFSIPGQQDCDRSRENLLGRNRGYGAAQKEGNFRLREQDRGGASASSHDMVSRLRRIQQDYADSIEGAQETEPVKGPLREGKSNPGGIQRRANDSMPRVEEGEQGAGSSDDRSIDLGGKRVGLSDSIRLREQEQIISFHGENKLLADLYQDEVHGEQERQLRGHSSSGVYSSSREAREDSCDPFSEGHRSSNGGISSNCRAKSYEHRSDDSLSGDQEMRRQSVSEDCSATQEGYQDDKLERSVRGEQESKKVAAQAKRTKDGEKKHVVDSANNPLTCEKLGDLLSSIQDLSISGMHYRSSQLDKATNKLIAETEAGAARGTRRIASRRPTE